MGEKNLSENDVLITYLIFQIIQADLKVSMLLAENNVPLAFADKSNAIVTSTFSDSKIAKEYIFLYTHNNI